jgi:hypothetical protein
MQSNLCISGPVSRHGRRSTLRSRQENGGRHVSKFPPLVSSFSFTHLSPEISLDPHLRGTVQFGLPKGDVHCPECHGSLLQGPLPNLGKSAEKVSNAFDIHGSHVRSEADDGQSPVRMLLS